MASSYNVEELEILRVHLKRSGDRPYHGWSIETKTGILVE